MKIEFIKKIHKEDGKPDRFSFTVVNGDHLFQYCCDKAKNAGENGFFEVAYNKRERVDLNWEERRSETEQETPLICLLTNEITGCDEAERKMYPIDCCPFCGAKNEIILVQVKEITHIFTKKTVPEHEEKEHTTQEKIVFDSSVQPTSEVVQQ